MREIRLPLLSLLALLLAACVLAAQPRAARADGDGSALSSEPIAASQYLAGEADGSSWGDRAAAADADSGGGQDCCHQIIEQCHSFSIRCVSLCHKCVTPYKPCAPCLPELSGCHKPMVTCYPGAPCLRELCDCHKPAVVVKPEVCCYCQLTLTGSRELIADAKGCDCECHDHDHGDGSSWGE